LIPDRSPTSFALWRTSALRQAVPEIALVLGGELGVGDQLALTTCPKLPGQMIEF
jgi:hypothetical protein